jgi:biopolymer transport protein TolR
MTFGGRDGGDSISEINVTPLVDVMLVLLIIFMVTAPILQQGVSIDLPKVTSAALPGADEQLVVNIAKTGQVYLNDAPYGLPELTEKLRAIVGERRDRPIYLRADQAVAYGQVMRTMTAVREAGLTRVGLVTEPPPEPH